MLIKLIGASLILASTTMAGFQIAKRLRERPRQLLLFQSGLQMLETHISYRATPLPEALLHVSKFVAGQPGRFFGEAAAVLAASGGLTASDAWQVAIDTVWPDMCLSQSDKETLAALGCYLGLSDKEDQVKHLRLVKEHLMLEEVKAREDCAKNERMWKWLGVYGGIAAVILLI